MDYDPHWIVKAGELLKTETDPSVRAAVLQEVERQALIGRIVLSNAKSDLQTFGVANDGVGDASYQR